MARYRLTSDQLRLIIEDANKFRSRYGIGLSDVVNIDACINAMGIAVFPLYGEPYERWRLEYQAGKDPDFADKLMGFFAPTVWSMYIHERLGTARARFVKAHELGHAFLDHWQGGADFLEARHAEAEAEASAFGLELLCPRAAMSTLLDSLVPVGQNPGLHHLRKMADHFIITPYTAVRRYVELTPLPAAVVTFRLPAGYRGHGNHLVGVSAEVSRRWSGYADARLLSRHKLAAESDTLAAYASLLLRARRPRGWESEFSALVAHRYGGHAETFLSGEVVHVYLRS